MIGKTLRKIMEQLLSRYSTSQCIPNVSKHDSNHEKEVILSMVPNGEGWHYLAVKKLSALLGGITFKHHSDFYCLNCLDSFTTENKRESHKKHVKIFL